MADHAAFGQRAGFGVHIDELHRSHVAFAIERREGKKDESAVRNNRHGFLVPIRFAPSIAVATNVHAAAQRGIGRVAHIEERGRDFTGVHADSSEIAANRLDVGRPARHLQLGFDPHGQRISQIDDPERIDLLEGDDVGAVAVETRGVQAFPLHQREALQSLRPFAAQRIAFQCGALAPIGSPALGHGKERVAVLVDFEFVINHAAELCGERLAECGEGGKREKGDAAFRPRPTLAP